MEYIKFILTVIGIGYFITESSLAKPFREATTKLKIKHQNWITDKIQGVFSCIYCASFWIAIAVYLVTKSTINIETVLYAFSCMGSIYVIKNFSAN
jgi:hypothetical protein